MKSFIPNQAASIVQEHRNYRRYAMVLVCLGVVVALGTMLGLRMYGQALTKEVRVFDCAVAPHEHSDACYVEIDGEKLLNCGQADYLVHTHNLDCYDEETGTLVCTLPEIKAHEHTADCWLVTRELTCGLEETPAHTHDETCLQEVRTLTCGQEEVPAHTHTEACYTAGEPTLACGLEEHTHTDACYAAPAEGAEPELVCGLEEHAHTEACYAAAEPTLTCGLEETAGHTHTDDCYTVTTEIACGLTERPWAV